MIERLLAAQRALDAGQLDMAEVIFGQVAEADPRSAIAVTGLADVARRKGRLDDAARLVDRALDIDPDDATAGRMRSEIAEATEIGEGPEVAGPLPEPGTGAPGTGLRGTEPSPAAAPPRRSLLDRLRSLFGRRP